MFNRFNARISISNCFYNESTLYGFSVARGVQVLKFFVNTFFSGGQRLDINLDLCTTRRRRFTTRRRIIFHFNRTLDGYYAIHGRFSCVNKTQYDRVYKRI